MKRGGAVYMLTNKNNTTIYTGVTSDLLKRLYEHRTGKFKYSFSKRYHLYKLVYYEGCNRIEEAIAREKQIKGGSRAKKEILINSMNPDWRDLSYDLGYED